MDGTIKWYDSNWLRAYLAAKREIARVAPSRLAEFTGTLDVLRTDPNFSVRDLPGFFDAERRTQIKEVIARIPRKTWEMYEFQRFGRVIVQDEPEFTELQATLVDQVCELAGEEIEPHYNFLSLYTRLGVCEPHLDSPSSKWTLDVCIDQSDPWPIHFSQIVPWPEGGVTFDDDWMTAIKTDSRLQFEAKTLHPGDAVFFSGSSQWHYRDGFQSARGDGFCHLLFFHFVPKGMLDLVRPENWARLFDVPELAAVQEIRGAL